MKVEEKTKTESISVRVDKELKKEFFKYLDDNNMSFSKWFRSVVGKEIKKGGGK